VRKVLAEQIRLTANRENYAPVDDLPKDHEFFFYQDRVNNDIKNVASHNVIARHQKEYKVDYRAESQPNPVKELANIKKDNTKIARA
jgi:hypothetical protein